MNNLIKINLLPYREEMNKRKQQQFKTLMYGAVLTGVAAVAATYLFIDNMINKQSEKNTLLEISIAHLDTELSEIQKLKQEKDAFLIKKNKIGELQIKRLQAAKILDSLNVAVPGSTYLTSLDAVTADTYRLSGRTSSDNRVAAMMRGDAQYRHIQATRIVKHQEKQFASRIYPSGNITTYRKGGRIQRESGFGKRTGGKLNGF
uniref:PilN n=1 Tax=Neisseria gonorrhoeae TaxID=485 RepID=O05129_NEIGO|nr:PilN [Neisseria gonorrhoeae]